MIRNYLGSPRRLAFRGVAAIVFGIATLLWPDVTLWASSCSGAPTHWSTEPSRLPVR